MTEEARFYVEVGILIATIAAIIVGPIIAVKIGRDLEDRREKLTRKYEIFSDLMKTRRARLETVHYSALNLIELEFYGCGKVITAFRAYAENLANYPEERALISRHVVSGDALFATLLKEIALELDYEFDKDDLNRLSYFPRGVGDHQDAIIQNTKLMSEVLEGRRAIPIKNFIQNDSLFPPPPEK